MSSSNALTRIRRNVVSKNVSTFFICLCLATLLWIIHALNVNYKFTLNVPVKFLNLPSNKVIVGDLPDKLSIDIKASGLKLLLINLKKELQELTIDFNSLKTNAKSQAYSISNGNFNLKSSSSVLPLCNTPLRSNNKKFSCLAPNSSYSIMQAMAAAPAPFTTNFTFSIFFF